MVIDFDIGKVSHYADSYAVFDGENPDFLRTLDGDRLCALVHFNDYESLSFCVLSDYAGRSAVLVYDNLCGDIVGSFDSIASFCAAVMEEIDGDIEE